MEPEERTHGRSRSAVMNDERATLHPMCHQPSQGVCRRIARADDWLYYMLRSPIRPLLRVHVQVRQQSTPIKVSREALNARQFRGPALGGPASWAPRLPLAAPPAAARVRPPTGMLRRRRAGFSTTSSSATTAAAASSKHGAHHRWRVALAMVAGAGASAAVYYYFLVEWEEEANAAIEAVDALDPPPEAFVHPYTQKPWYWRVLFTLKRLFYITYVFLPVTAISVVSTYVYPDSEVWRNRLLDALLHAMEKAGCCFMKLGQWISMRPDMFPRDFVETMSRLRQGVPPHSWDETVKAVRQGLGADWADIFEFLETTPVASGTVAQVHRGRLKEEYAINGTIRDVAVKVRHPNILDETFVDLDIIFGFVDTFLPSRFSLPCSQDELTHILRQQLDLKCEAYNLWKFTSNFRSELKAGLINFPQVCKRLVSDSVLVESWVDGSTIATMFSELEAAGDHTWASARTMQEQFTDAMKDKKKQLARILFDLNVKMFLRDNYVHGDMHAGNLIFSMEDGRVTVIDAGLITSLQPDVANQFGEFLRGLCQSDADVIVDRLLLFNVSKADIDKVAFRDKIREICEDWKHRSAHGDGDKRAFALGDVVGEILLNLQKYKIVLRGDVAASIMTISVSEGLILQLDPDFDMVRSALPFFVRYKGWKTAEAAFRGHD